MVNLYCRTRPGYGIGGARSTGHGAIITTIFTGPQYKVATGRRHRHGRINIYIVSSISFKVSSGCRNSRIHVHVPKGVQRQGRWGRPGDRFVYVDIAVPGNSTAVGNVDTRCNQIPAKGGASNVPPCCDSEVLRIDQPGA
jgi:hypothetical protein